MDIKQFVNIVGLKDSATKILKFCCIFGNCKRFNLFWKRILQFSGSVRPFLGITVWKSRVLRSYYYLVL